MYNPDPKFEKKLNNALRGAGKGLRNGSKKLGRAFLKGAKVGITSSKNSLVKWAIIVGLVFFFISFISYFATDENIGETQNLVDYGNSITYDEDGKPIVDSYSPANSACLEFYKVLSRNKSTWQVYKDENGEEILIRPTDERAVKDHFKNDEDFILDPYFLYSVADALYSETYVYPEGFLNPVAYDKDTYTLLDVRGEEDECLVESRALGDSNEKVKNVSDYGLATVLIYEKKSKSASFDYSYVSELKMTEEGLKEVEYTNPVMQSIPLPDESEDYYVLSKAITFAGEITYDYEETYSCTSNVKDGIGTEEEFYIKVDCGEVTETCYYALPKYGPQTEDRTIYSTSAEYLWNNYCKNGSYYMPTKADEETGQPVGLDESNPDFSLVKQTNYTYKKYKIRSSSSGIYEHSWRNSKRTTDDKGIEYLYDYLGLYTTYAPSVERSYSVFKSFSSTSNNDNSFLVLNSGASEGSSEGGYNGEFCSYSATQVKNAKMIWDGCIQWGYSEEQASAILGNVMAESGFRFSAKETLRDGSEGPGRGICQWTPRGRFEADDYGRGLVPFTASKGLTWEDEESQIQFLCMELDIKNTYTYASMQWDTNGAVKNCEVYRTKDEAKALWDSSESIAELTTLMCEHWERPEYSNAKIRVKYANDFYKLFAGSEVEYEIEVIEPSSTLPDTNSSGGTYIASGTGFNEVDKKAFSEFYYAGEITNETELFYYERYLSENEVKNILYKTDSFMNHTTITDQSQKGLGDNLWESGYLTRISNERNDRETYLVTGNYDFILPTSTKSTILTSVFGPRDIGSIGSKGHGAIDIGTGFNEPIFAVCSGTIVSAGYSNSMGNYIVLETTMEDGKVLQFTYMHNSSLSVSNGDKVTKGTVIALSGSTGNSTGPHCHLGLTVDGITYNPLLYCYGEDITKLPSINTETGEVEYITFNVSAGGSFQTWDYYMYFDPEKGYVPSGLGSLK